MGESTEHQNFFTKHLFRAGLQCAVKLYYYAHEYPQDDRSRPFIEHAGYNKYQLRKLLHSLYPDGRPIKSGGYIAAFEETMTELKAEETTLFNAVFIHDGCVAKVPLLVKKGTHVQLYFVQSKAMNPHKHRLSNHAGELHKKWKQYIYDAAYQYYVIQQCNPNWEISSQLLVPDKTFSTKVDALNKLIQQPNAAHHENELLHAIDIKSQVFQVLSGQEATLLPSGFSFEKTLEVLKARYFSREWNPGTIGKKCKNCEFRLGDLQMEAGAPSGFHKCWNESQQIESFSPSEPHVFELIGAGGNQLIEEGIYFQKDVPLDGLPNLEVINKPSGSISHNQRQALQVMKAKGLPIPDEIIKTPLLTEISRWEFPLHFLDFEAGNYAVPIRQHRSPYHLVLFQFSCHTLRSDGSLFHHEWIAEGQIPYPNYELVRHLAGVPDIGEGTIIQYSNFERTSLKTIRKELIGELEEIPDAEHLIVWLESIIQRNDSNKKNGPYLADLSRLVKYYYYNRFMADSLSIKDVVQAILTLSPVLKQHYKVGYDGSNFNDMHWWQWNVRRGEVYNPYQLLRALQPGVKVGRGTEAMITFAKILNNSLRADQKDRAIKALLQYCELDTLAMVMIYQHWNKQDGNG